MNRLPPRKLVWKIWVALILITLNALPASSQEKRTKVTNLQRRPDHHRAAAACRARLGNFQCQRARCRNHRHEPAPWRRGDGSGRHRLRCRRRPGIGGRHPHRACSRGRSGFPRIGSPTGFRPRRSTRRCKISKAKRSPSPAASAAPIMSLLSIALEKIWLQPERLYDGRDPRPANSSSLFPRIRLCRSRADVAAAYFRRGEERLSSNSWMSAPWSRCPAAG